METVLIIEDDEDSRDALIELLAMEGHLSVAATNGREALDQLDAGLKPCLILLDLMLPIQSGWEFRRRQLQEPRWAEIPTVLVSAADDLPAQAALLRTNAFLAKPLDLRSLYQTVSRYC